MAITRTALPDDVAEAMASELGAQAAAHGGEATAWADGGGAAGEPGEGIDAVPIYGIDEMQLRADPEAALKDARPIGWRTVCADPEEGEDGIALVDSYNGEEAGAASQVRVIRGPTVSRFAAVGTLAEEELEGVKAKFEPRILDFGTLGLTALWMHSAKAADRFYPLGDEDAKRRTARFVLNEAIRRAERQPRPSETGGGTDAMFDREIDAFDDRGG